jgi:hypothetical protein
MCLLSPAMCLSRPCPRHHRRGLRFVACGFFSPGFGLFLSVTLFA